MKINILFIFFLFLIFNLKAQKTVVEIKGNQFYINGKPTYEGRVWNGHKIEGLLMNSRMVQGIFDDLNPETVNNFTYPDTKKWDADRNNNEFIAAMPLWKSYGLNAFTLNMQGGSPIGYGNWDFQNPGFNPDGSLHEGYMKRLDKILKKADELNMVVILGLFYFGQDQRLKDETAIKNAVTNMVNWLFEKEYRHVLIEINNETQNDLKHYDHTILLKDRIHELINLAKSIEKKGYRYLVSTSFPAVVDPTANVINAADFVLFHANALRTWQSFSNHIEKVKKVVGNRKMPIVINEDDNNTNLDADTSHFNIALKNYISWGYFDYRKKDDPNLKEGFQTIPVDWGINSEKKKVFFNKIKEVTDANTEGGKTSENDAPTIVEILEIDTVWAANKVSFALQTVGNQQFIAYYDKNRMMTVASRTLDSKTWNKKTLNNKLHWDSHNSVVLGIDEKGFIHVSGNMHVNPLVYFRSTKPYVVQSMVELNTMTGEDEKNVTYPKFFNDKAGKLYYSYRSGSSGNGNTFVNQYLTEQNKWVRYITKPLFVGISKTNDRSAYHHFVRDKAGNFHFSWVWRWTPLVETTHQLCYATSPDLIHWKNVAGEDINLPHHPDDPKLIVDNTPTKGGMHNGKYRLIITPDQKPLIGYLKYDEKGLTKFYLAHFKNGAWVSKKISDWDFRWKFIGGGDGMTEGGVFNFVGFSKEGLLVIDWSNETQKSGRYVVDPNTLELSDKKVTITEKIPLELKKRMTNAPKLSVSLQEDEALESGNERYFLKWETKGKSHGEHAPKVIPEYPRSALLLVKVK
jgi:hypothetical protein